MIQAGRNWPAFLLFGQLLAQLFAPLVERTLSTPISSNTPYVTPTQAQAFVDWRNLGDLLSDNDDRLTQAEVIASPYWATLLLSSAGEIESACGVGGRYLPADLQTLTGASMTYLQQLNTVLAFWRATQRRYPGMAPKDVVGAQQALDALVALRNSEVIFGLVEVMAANNGYATNLYPNPQYTFTGLACRYFGTTNNQFSSGPFAG